MARRKVGRVREKLAEVILRDLGLVVDPYDLWMQEGFYRRTGHDLARWGTLHAHYPDRRNRVPIHLSSWDTMTDCVRYGVEAFDADGFWDVSRKSAPAGT